MSLKFFSVLSAFYSLKFSPYVLFEEQKKTKLPIMSTPRSKQHRNNESPSSNRKRSLSQDGIGYGREKRAKHGPTKKRKVRITADDSLFFSKKFAEHKKNWSHFFDDDDVVSTMEYMQYERDSVKQHLAYLQRKLKLQHSAGSKHREKIVQILEDEEDIEDPLTISSEVEGEEKSLNDERLLVLDELNKNMQDETAITSLEAATGFENWVEEQKTQKQVRSSRIQEKAEEKKEIVNMIRAQTQQQEQNNQTRMATSLLFMKVMEKALATFEKDTNTTKPDKPDADWIERVRIIEEKIDRLLDLLSSPDNMGSLN
jgi:hypothetical protein